MSAQTHYYLYEKREFGPTFFHIDTCLGDKDLSKRLMIIGVALKRTIFKRIDTKKPTVQRGGADIYVKTSLLKYIYANGQAYSEEEM